jgi:hypothetical protein
MSFDEHDDEFDPLNPIPDEQGWATVQEIQRENERIQNLPLMRKARQIYATTEAFLASIPEDQNFEHYRIILLENALQLESRISSAEGCDLYTRRMENAVMIKVAARNLLTQLNGLEQMNYSEPAYLGILRREINEFRILFLDWINSFDRKKDIPDDWGLFNI